MSNPGRPEAGGYFDPELMRRDQEAIKEAVGDGPFADRDEVEGSLETSNVNATEEAVSLPERQN